MVKSADSLQQLLKEVDARKKELDSLLPMRHEDEERLWKKLRLEWNYNSNHIEGNTLTYQETELVLIFDQAPNGSHTVREIEEMKAHDVAVALVRDWANDEKRELSETDIRDLNRILLVRPFWKEALTPDGQPTRRLITVGDYKKHPNSVRLPNGEMFHYASPEETPRNMAEFVAWYRQASKEQHPVVVAARLHYDFVRIHPFDDGNGRVSRLLMNYHLLRNSFPPVVIKSTDKKNYLAALQRADVGDSDAFAVYIAEQILWSLDLSIRASKGESVEEAGDWEKQIEILKREAEVIKEQEDRKKLSLKEGIANWLEKNFPILREEMEKRVGKFSEFFNQSKLKIVSVEGNRQTILTLKPMDWSKFASSIIANKFTSRIVISYEFKGFKYKPDNESKLLKTLPITISFSQDKVIISSVWKNISRVEVPIFKNLQISDLQTFRDLGLMFYQQIQQAISD